VNVEANSTTGRPPARARSVAAAPSSDTDTAFYGRVTSLIYNYRTLGHTQAHINPLEENPERNPRDQKGRGGSK